MQILPQAAEDMADIDTTTLEHLFALNPSQLEQWLHDHQIPVPGRTGIESHRSDTEKDPKGLKSKSIMPRTRSKREESEKRSTYSSIHAKSARSSITSTKPITTRSKAALLVKPIEAQNKDRVNSHPEVLLASTPSMLSLSGEENDALPFSCENDVRPDNTPISSNHYENVVKGLRTHGEFNLNSHELDAKISPYKPAKTTLPLKEVKEYRGAHEANIVKKVLIRVNSDEVDHRNKAKSKNEDKKILRHHKEDDKMRLHNKERDKEMPNHKEHDKEMLNHNEHDKVSLCQEDDMMGMNHKDHDKVSPCHNDDTMSMHHKKEEKAKPKISDDGKSLHHKAAPSEPNISNKEGDGDGHDVTRIQRLKRSANLMMSNINEGVIKRIKRVHLARPSPRASIIFVLYAMVTSIGVASYMYHLKKLEEQRARSRRWW